MKTGILTFVHTGNYGAVLQAYAMQTLLGKIGVDNEFVDYFCPAIAKKHDPRMLRFKHGLKNKLLLPFMYFVYKKRQEKFIDFENKYLKFSDLKYSRENITSSVDCYDAFLVGSDQVWNPMLTDGDMTFFLDFIPEKNKKLTFAASIGTTDFPEEYSEKCYDLIRRFNFVNVREKSAVQTLKNSGIDASRVIDPTLMLSKEEWMNLVGDRPNDKKYILLYMPPSDSDSVRQIKAYAKKNNYEVFLVKKEIKATNGFKVLNTLSPTEFLTWLYHAECIISGSFHGVCFSVLLEKPFWAFSAPTKNLTVRTDDILSELGLDKRKYSKYSDFSQNNIDYETVFPRLDKLRADSMKILKQMIQAR